MNEAKSPEVQADELLKKYQEEELVSYIRDTVVRLETLADRLEGYIREEPDDH